MGDRVAIDMDLVRERMLAFAADNNVKVLLAVESGSRGWGFPGKDSDWDCRFMFVRPKEAYLSVYQQPEQLNYKDDEYGGDLDIIGWDIRKVLRCAAQGNVVMAEWAQSPVVYYDEGDDFRDYLLEAAVHPWYRRSEALTAYLGMAGNAASSARRGVSEHDRQSEEGLPWSAGSLRSLPSKKFLYYVRTILAASWAESGRPVPDMNIVGLLKGLEERSPWYHKHAADIMRLVNEKAFLREKDLFSTPVQEGTLRMLYGMEQLALSATFAEHHKAQSEPLPPVSRQEVDSVFFDILRRHAPALVEV